MKLLRYLCIPFLFLLTGCAGCGDDDALAFARTPYTGNQLRIDGYYYDEYSHVQNYLEVYFFYTNGIILSAGAFEADKLPEQEKYWQTSQWQETVKKFKSHWGVFKIEGDIFQFDRWH
ncbi:MAG TPA: hypothetical protein VEC36_13990, partial [Patescibacteria group bacterium]|nr:hypothetical protein [Patescibacteria group bacterium]